MMANRGPMWNGWKDTLRCRRPISNSSRNRQAGRQAPTEEHKGKRRRQANKTNRNHSYSKQAKSQDMNKDIGKITWMCRWILDGLSANDTYMRTHS